MQLSQMEGLGWDSEPKNVSRHPGGDCHPGGGGKSTTMLYWWSSEAAYGPHQAAAYEVDNKKSEAFYSEADTSIWVQSQDEVL